MRSLSVSLITVLLFVTSRAAVCCWSALLVFAGAVGRLSGSV